MIVMTTKSSTRVKPSAALENSHMQSFCFQAWPTSASPCSLADKSGGLKNAWFLGARIAFDFFRGGLIGRPAIRPTNWGTGEGRIRAEITLVFRECWKTYES